MNSTKRCTKCQEEKPATLEFFYKRGRGDALRSDCKKCNGAYSKKVREENIEQYLEKEAESRQRRRENGYAQEYYQKNKEHINARNQRNYYENKEERLAKGRAWKYEKYQTDSTYKLTVLLRGRFRNALKNNSKSASVLTLIGCSIEELKEYLEQQFTEGMTWENYGEWHVDHIRPCASFDLSIPEQQQECFHYTNLQPLWAKDNLQKSDKIL